MSAQSSSQWSAPIRIAPNRLAEIQAEFSRNWYQIAASTQQGKLQAPADRRFSTEAWVASPSALLAAHTYLLSANAITQMVDAAQVEESVRNRLHFSVMQWIEALSPANFLATNPEVQRAIIESNGQSLTKGLCNLLNDIENGTVTQSDETGFKLGKTIATTTGSVVFQNALMQVIQYAPASTKVYEKPLLIVPPCINKFYILDLQPENSFVKHAVEQGFTVFLISWRNPLSSDTDGIQQASWADYLSSGVLQAVDVARDVSGQDQINALGFCVGGTLLASALALAHAKGDAPVGALTLLTTLLDFHETGVLDVFVDEQHAQHRERQLGAGGLMAARELGTTFSFLRPSELVWNYVVGNYLKGQTPPAFDLLYWNADGTNLPGPFFTWYFRNTYLENKLKIPGKVKVDGYPLDLGTLNMPAYIYGSREDHIVPWPAAYASTAILKGPLRFVLGASGHIAGVINPPAKNRRAYWTHESSYSQSTIPSDAQSWLETATERPGSWWPDWSEWLVQHSGAQIPASKKLGNHRHRPLEPAPGSYVQVKAF